MFQSWKFKKTSMKNSQDVLKHKFEMAVSKEGPNKKWNSTSGFRSCMEVLTTLLTPRKILTLKTKNDFLPTNGLRLQDKRPTWNPERREVQVVTAQIYLLGECQPAATIYPTPKKLVRMPNSNLSKLLEAEWGLMWEWRTPAVHSVGVWEFTVPG